PVILVLRGKDEKTTAKFLTLALKVAEGELARQESKDKVQRSKFQGIDVAAIGKGLFLARPGPFLVASNRKEVVKYALGLALGKSTKSLAANPHVAASRKLLPKNPLANLWINLEPAQKSEVGKALYKTPRDNFQLTVLFGQYLDVAGRAPY